MTIKINIQLDSNDPIYYKLFNYKNRKEKELYRKLSYKETLGKLLEDKDE